MPTLQTPVNPSPPQEGVTRGPWKAGPQPAISGQVASRWLRPTKPLRAEESVRTRGPGTRGGTAGSRWLSWCIPVGSGNSGWPAWTGKVAAA